jgi:uncharacterized membrane protein
MAGAILILMPNLTRRRLLFAVPVSADFRESNAGRRAIALFRTIVALATIAFLAGQLAVPLSGLYGALAPILLTAVAAVAFYKANRMVVPFRATGGGEPSMEMSVAPERLPRNLVWLSIGPLVLLGGAAAILIYQWNSIPQTFPVHWDLTGTADRWAEKNIRGVFGPLLFGTEVCVWLAVCALVSWFGARRGSLRSSVMELMVAVEYVIAFVFGLLGLLPLMRIPAWLTILAVIAPMPLLILLVMKKASEPSDPPEKTPEECWKAGVVYYNPSDPALVVEKRTGFGYTLNFGNRLSWVLAAGLVLVLVSVPLILP